MGGIILHLIDTAGVRDTKDPVEKIGISKTLKALDDAELVLLVLDHETGIEEEDKELLELSKNKKRIIIANKCDITNDMIPDIKYIDISALNKEGLEELEKEIHNYFINDSELLNIDTAISSSRHIALLKNANTSLNNALNGALNSDFIDMVSIDLKDAYDTLGLITGETSSDSLVDELFKKFCLGK